jgi:HEAT repeat protein
MPDLETLLAELTSGDDARAEAAVPRLAELGEEAAQALAPLTRDENADTRWWAVRALAAIQEVDIAELLVDGLSDPDLGVRQCAALALRERPDPYTLPELIYLLEDEDKLLVRLAADALIALGAVATEQLLAVVRNSKVQYARMQATRALAEIGDTGSVKLLFEILDEDSALMEYWASHGLDKMGFGMAFFKPG